MLARSFLPLLAAADVTVGGAEELPFSPGAANLITNSIHWVTNVAQFRTLSSADYLAGCDFQLTGVVTLTGDYRFWIASDNSSELWLSTDATPLKARKIASVHLDRLGLTQAIRASVNQASENSPILFASRVENIDGLFDNDAEIHVYRIVQEAITNVVKHSAVTEAIVVIKKQPAAVSISIRDNGRGFDPAKLSSPPHNFGYGLSGIAERVRILKGTVVIDSRPGAGTSLAVEVPFKIS